MSEPIISPWAVYFITRLDAVRGFMISVICLAFLASIALPMLADLLGLYNSKKVLKRGFKTIAVTLIALAAGLAILPTTKEAMMIYAASKVTPQTIQAAGDSIDKAVDKVVEKMLMLSKQEDK